MCSLLDSAGTFYMIFYTGSAFAVLVIVDKVCADLSHYLGRIICHLTIGPHQEVLIIKGPFVTHLGVWGPVTAYTRAGNPSATS